MRVLVLTTLYPNAKKPNHGVFVENRLRRVIRHARAVSEGNAGALDVKVIAPVPWFPSEAKIFGSYADFAATPKSERRHGIEILHPRYFLPPKVGMTYAVASLTKCFEAEAEKLLARGWDFDLIDAHYYYPDGVAATRMAESFDKPIIITARGTDINLIPQYPKQKKMILDATESAAQSITVCKALKDEMVAIGANKEKITVLRNGVDLELFKPEPRKQARAKFGATGQTILSIGHLVERKGHYLIIEALKDLPDVILFIAGSGPDEKSLRQLAITHGVETRVKFLGQVDHDQLSSLYSSVDALILASSREGWPNVLLEAMACGTPCVATPVWGTGEVITKPEAGMLTGDRTVQSIGETISSMLNNLPDRTATRKYAEGFSWDDTAKGVYQIFRDAINQKHSASPEAITSVPNTSLLRTWKTEDFPVHSTQSQLIVTVDTEEIFDWSANEFDRHRVAKPDDIHQFQELCETHHIKPLYFLTYSLITDADNAAYFSKLAKEGRADLGLHLHQWVTPPTDEEVTARTSYQCNLPQEAHIAKLQKLQNAFENAFGFQAISHRAGRYGVSPQVLDDLAMQGVRHDFSPSAGYDLSKDGGPDFSHFGSHPFLRKTKDGHDMAVYPATGGRAIRGTRLFTPQPLSEAGRYWTKNLNNQMPSAPIRLSPEGFGYKDLISLSAFLAKQSVIIQTFSLHSTSLTIGATPYSQTELSVQELLARTHNYFEWFKKDFQGRFITLSDLENNVRFDSTAKVTE